MGMIENEMVGWHHRLDGHEFEQAPGVGDGQGSLSYCSPWGCEESDTTEQLNQPESESLPYDLNISLIREDIGEYKLCGAMPQYEEAPRRWIHRCNPWRRLGYFPCSGLVIPLFLSVHEPPLSFQ